MDLEKVSRCNNTTRYEIRGCLPINLNLVSQENNPWYKEIDSKDQLRSWMVNVLLIVCCLLDIARSVSKLCLPPPLPLAPNYQHYQQGTLSSIEIFRSSCATASREIVYNPSHRAIETYSSDWLPRKWRKTKQIKCPLDLGVEILKQWFP